MPGTASSHPPLALEAGAPVACNPCASLESL
jgi:hypothetical protein